MNSRNHSKRSSKSAKNDSNPKAPKVKKATDIGIDYNEYFAAGKLSAENQSSSKNLEPEKSDTMTNVSKPALDQPKICDENEGNELTKDQLALMVQNMSAALEITLKHLKSACETIHVYRTKSTLGICDTKSTEADAPLLTIFEKYNLPLQTKEDVEKLEAELELSTDFLDFFVSTVFKKRQFQITAVNKCLISLDSSHRANRKEFVSNTKGDLGGIRFCINFQGNHAKISMVRTIR